MPHAVFLFCCILILIPLCVELFTDWRPFVVYVTKTTVCENLKTHLFRVSYGHVS